MSRRSSGQASRRGRSIAVVAIVFLAAASSQAADRIVLRDFRIIRDASIMSLDVDGILLSVERPGGSKRVTWDEVQRLQLTDRAKQTEADKLLQEVGEPLFRLRVRMEIGDDEGLLEPAEALFPVFRDRSSASAYLVLQSLVWGRIAHARREEAVEPWLLAYGMLRSRSAKVSDLPGRRKPGIDAATGLLAELEPVWFDADAAQAALPGAEAALKSLAEPVPTGARLYVASLALASGNMERGDKYLQGKAADGTSAAHLQQILQAQRDVLQNKTPTAINRLQSLANALEESPNNARETAIDYRPLAWYWLGRAQLSHDASPSRSEGLLTLMQIPALYGSRSPDLSAAALHEAAQAYSADAPLAARLRSEIREQFAGSWHARRLREASNASSR